MDLPRVKVLKLGTLLAEPGADDRYVTLRALLGIGGGSTVTLIECGDGKLILVDTGFDREWDLSEENVEKNAESLRAALKGEGLGPDDVDVVFLTHHHLDHAGNLHMFTSARWLGVEAAGGADKGPGGGEGWGGDLSGREGDLHPGARRLTRLPAGGRHPRGKVLGAEHPLPSQGGRRRGRGDLGVLVQGRRGLLA